MYCRFDATIYIGTVGYIDVPKPRGSVLHAKTASPLCLTTSIITLSCVHCRVSYKRRAYTMYTTPCNTPMSRTGTEP